MKDLATVCCLIKERRKKARSSAVKCVRTKKTKKVVRLMNTLMLGGQYKKFITHKSDHQIHIDHHRLSQSYYICSYALLIDQARRTRARKERGSLLTFRVSLHLN